MQHSIENGIAKTGRTKKLTTQVGQKISNTGITKNIDLYVHIHQQSTRRDEKKITNTGGAKKLATQTMLKKGCECYYAEKAVELCPASVAFFD